jgi:hypothetical protein
MVHYREPENWKAARNVASFTEKGEALFYHVPSNKLYTDTLKNKIDY